MCSTGTRWHAPGAIPADPARSSTNTLFRDLDPMLSGGHASLGVHLGTQLGVKIRALKLHARRLWVGA
jgi:hypothetical protein